VGIDGYGSNDLLQAGIEQRVTAGGQTDYVAWCAWFAAPQADSPAYVWQTNILNFPVRAGQQIHCSVQYVAKVAGHIYFANQSTGHHLSLTLAAPPGAAFRGDSMEWIMEATDHDADQPATSLPKFSPVQFATALGCDSNGSVLANPRSGDYVNIAYKKRTVTAVELGDDTVTVRYTG
jgi:hypothetical protein